MVFLSYGIIIRSTEGQIFLLGVILKMMSVTRLITHLGETTWASTRGNEEATVVTQARLTVAQTLSVDGGVEVMAAPAPLPSPFTAENNRTQGGELLFLEQALLERGAFSAASQNRSALNVKVTVSIPPVGPVNSEVTCPRHRARDGKERSLQSCPALCSKPCFWHL